MLENIRIDAAEKRALLYAIKDITEEVYLFGSRLNSLKKGGDIDILIFSTQNSLDLSRKISRKFFMECEEKIDVLVLNKENLTEEQKAFINTIKPVRIK
ncbi:MAG: nucleotidyltransferase domain-containing protein [Ignavibacteriales bacterium]|nr:nucleotidyltransferase domain-containing protein [Ignavibacteriales bacterium]